MPSLRLNLSRWSLQVPLRTMPWSPGSLSPGLHPIHVRAMDSYGRSVDATAHLFTVSSFRGVVVFVAAVLLVVCVGDVLALPAVVLWRARASAVVIVVSREVPLPCRSAS